MLRLYNTLSKSFEVFHPFNKSVVSVFTCGPSVYQRAHIGNFRTFLIEDILLRYLEFLGYRVIRGMNFTDIEDKAINEAEKRNLSLKTITENNIRKFIHEMKMLRMKKPEFLPRASENIDMAINIIEILLRKGIAYKYKNNIYFDALKFKGFGKLYGLDLSKWPEEKKRFHKDTYPGIQWNLGDFILWHGCKENDKYCWNSPFGPGRPAWNVQDPSMVLKHFSETLSIYCGGIDNLYRHHDYSLAIIESVKPYPMARYWLHCQHLYIDGKKMSKSRGNILYIDDLRKKGYSLKEIRCFLICGHYREILNYSETNLKNISLQLKALRKTVFKIDNIAKRFSNDRISGANKYKKNLINIFKRNMDNDLHVKEAFNEIADFVSRINIDKLKPENAYKIIQSLKKIDKVLMVIF